STLLIRLSGGCIIHPDPSTGYPSPISQPRRELGLAGCTGAKIARRQTHGMQNRGFAAERSRF
ncbi:MAG: hypothetical protein ACXW39_05295, partial [Nitrospira sp.]